LPGINAQSDVCEERHPYSTLPLPIFGVNFVTTLPHLKPQLVLFADQSEYYQMSNDADVPEEVVELSRDDLYSFFGNADAAYENLFKLCEMCNHIFAHSSLVHKLEGEAEAYDWHNSLVSLQKSLDDGCHFCTLASSGLKKQEREDLPKPSDVHENKLVIEARSSRSSTVESEHAGNGFRVHGPLRINITLLNASAVFEVTTTSSSYDHWTPIHDALDQLSTTSVQHVALAGLFISHCQRHHHPSQSSCNWHASFVPKRLLKLSGRADTLRVKLYTTMDADQSLEYTCLSHCWGTDQTLCLTDSNAKVLENGIPVEDIPKTYLDAMHITLTLGIEHLWIDSLCIIQGNEDDWITQAAAMSDIYTNAYVTLAAAGASDSRGGCHTTRNPLTFAPCRIRGSTKQDSLFALPQYFMHGCQIEDLERNSTLFTRAWVFQERMLSPRVLYYGSKGLAFNCRCVFGCETDINGQAWPLQPTGRKHLELWEDPLADLEWLRCVRLRDRPFVQKDELHDTWCELLAAYTPLKMSNQGDKLLALSGVAKVVAEVQDVQLGYLAGLWRKCFIQGLLWYVITGHEARPQAYRAPSWSWAAIEGQVRNFDNGTAARFVFIWRTDLARLMEAQVSTHPSDCHQTGQVSGAYLRMKGMLKEAVLAKPASGRQSYDPTEELTMLDGATGKIHIDATGEATGEPLLMPLLARVDKNKHRGVGTDTPCQILGIVLHKIGTAYRRIGAYRMQDVTLRYFEGCEEQDIVFADGDQSRGKTDVG
jgi:hypothetical protein